MVVVGRVMMGAWFGGGGLSMVAREKLVVLYVRLSRRGNSSMKLFFLIVDGRDMICDR